MLLNKYIWLRSTISQQFIFINLNHIRIYLLLIYLSRYWLRRVGAQIMSVYGFPRRTNNNLESFHNQLRLKFSVTHPNLWIFLGKYINIYKLLSVDVIIDV